MARMDDVGLAESRRIDMTAVSDGCFREITVKRSGKGTLQTTEVTLWNRTVCLSGPESIKNVYLYESRQRDLRVLKNISRQNIDKCQELIVMDRVMKEVKYVHQQFLKNNSVTLLQATPKAPLCRIHWLVLVSR